MVKKHLEKGKLVGVTGSHEDYLKAKIPSKMSRVNPKGQRFQYGKLVSNGKTRHYQDYQRYKRNHPGSTMPFKDWAIKHSRSLLKPKLAGVSVAKKVISGCAIIIFN